MLLSEMDKAVSAFNKIDIFRLKMIAMTNNKLLPLSNKLRERVQDGEALSSVMPEAFALVREVCKRVMKINYHNQQIIGGVLLFNGNVAEMATGEGKTLTAVLPAYVYALTGKGVHIVTVNDYLAKCGADENRKLYEALGLSVGCVQHNMTSDERLREYECDVTYVTNSELGFDYLRDSRALYPQDRVLRGLHYAIIDEADSVLIDEARTPLIISKDKKCDTDFYKQTARLVNVLEKGQFEGEADRQSVLLGDIPDDNGDYIVVEKERAVYLTPQGVSKIEKALGITNYASDEHALLRYHIQVALKAKELMKRDSDYIVKDDEIIVVNEFTGRLAEGQRYSDGLQQALEAKEGVTVQNDSQIIASITYQSLFNKYEYKAGMTGTAMTSAKEFMEIYGFQAVKVPTHKPVIRHDIEDAVYLTRDAKFQAVVNCVKNVHKKRQPILIGTTSISDSEYLSGLLDEVNIRHIVLNAKQHEKEAEIIAKAGQAESVVIATNMAGRGTDIKLSDEAKQLGGLFVIGTQRHDSRRIDNQLQGRAGRQGDPGMSRFFVSLDDDLLRMFGGEKALSVLKKAGMYEDDVISYKGISKLIKKAQDRVESVHFGIRRTLMDFDGALSEQRELIFEQRRNIVNGANTSSLIEAMTITAAKDIVNKYYTDKGCVDSDAFISEWQKLFKLKPTLCVNKTIMLTMAQQEALRCIGDKRLRFETLSDLYSFQKMILLDSIDDEWSKHLETMDRLRQSFTFSQGKRSEAIVEYRLKAYEIFGEMTSRIAYNFVYLFLNRSFQKEKSVV